MPLAIDTESNTWNKGAPFDRRFKAVCYSWATESDEGASPFEPDSIERLQSKIDGARVLVGFNLKYDIHVLRKATGISFGMELRYWDCQLAEFVISRQTRRYPSLEESLVKYDLGHKIDVVKTEV